MLKALGEPGANPSAPCAKVDGTFQRNGEVPEWLNGAVSKTVVRASVPRVRIPLSPPTACRNKTRPN